MKKNILVSVIGFLILSSSLSVFAEYKTKGWQVGNRVWWLSHPYNSCDYTAYSWKIHHIKNGVAKIVSDLNKKITYKEVNQIAGHSTLESAKKNIQFNEKKCREKKALKERYEK